MHLFEEDSVTVQELMFNIAGVVAVAVSGRNDNDFFCTLLGSQQAVSAGLAVAWTAQGTYCRSSLTFIIAGSYFGSLTKYLLWQVKSRVSF